MYADQAYPGWFSPKVQRRKIGLKEANLPKVKWVEDCLEVKVKLRRKSARQSGC